MRSEFQIQYNVPLIHKSVQINFGRHYTSPVSIVLVSWWRLCEYKVHSGNQSLVSWCRRSPSQWLKTKPLLRVSYLLLLLQSCTVLIVVNNKTGISLSDIYETLKVQKTLCENRDDFILTLHSYVMPALTSLGESQDEIVKNLKVR